VQPARDAAPAGANIVSALTLAAVLAAPSASGAAATPDYAYTYTPPPATGSPRILSVDLNSDSLHAGGPIDIRVKTTPDVIRVTSGNGRQKGALSRSAKGVFVGDSTLPRVGGLLTLSIKIHIEATTADGKTTSVDVPVRYK